MPYLELYYHFVWCTKNRQPVLVGEVEALVHQFLREKAFDLGAKVYALNGIDDHVHMVARLPPSITVSKFIGQVKAIASLRLKRALPDCEEFGWQNSYAAITIGKPYIKRYVAYVSDQKAHHHGDKVHPALERTAPVCKMLKESQANYSVDEENWASWLDDPMLEIT